jgi:hypothetical protein
MPRAKFFISIPTFHPSSSLSSNNFLTNCLKPVPVIRFFRLYSLSRGIFYIFIGIGTLEFILPTRFIFRHTEQVPVLQRRPAAYLLVS